MPSGFYAYVYLDPRTDLPFYVGKGCGYRAKKHLHQCHNRSVARRLAELKVHGLEPEIQVYPTGGEDAALELERDLIKLYGRTIDKSGPLLNVLEAGDKSDGFRGHRHTPEARAKMSAVRRAKPHSPEHRANIIAAAKNRTFSALAQQRALEARRTPAFRAKMSEIIKAVRAR